MELLNENTTDIVKDGEKLRKDDQVITTDAVSNERTRK